MKFKKAADLIDSNNLLGIDELKRDARFESPMHYHEHYELFYLKSDSRRYIINDKIFDIKKGDLVLIRPYDLHKTVYIGGDQYNRILINFKDELFSPEEMPLLSIFNMSRTISMPPDNIGNLLAKMLHEFDRREPFYKTSAKALLIELLVSLNRLLAAQIAQASNVSAASRRGNKIEQIMKYINENHQNAITLSILSEIFSLSPFYICRLFKSNTGISFVDYLNTVRIKEAKQLLKNSSMNITETALSVGYADPSNFCRVFKKMTGMSPKAYKRQTAATTSSE